jgi:hypothetical protein
VVSGGVFLSGPTPKNLELVFEEIEDRIKARDSILTLSGKGV